MLAHAPIVKLARYRSQFLLLNALTALLASFLRYRHQTAALAAQENSHLVRLPSASRVRVWLAFTVLKRTQLLQGFSVPQVSTALEVLLTGRCVRQAHFLPTLV